MASRYHDSKQCTANLFLHSLRFIGNKGETVGFAASKAIVYWVLRGQQGSIPITRYTKKPVPLSVVRYPHSQHQCDFFLSLSRA